jgi:3alpha(or 20beta)-hydroxysteroid dehydrogenase
VSAPGGRLAGHIALVTGGRRGQGVAHVRRFVQEGASVVSADIADGLLADDAAAYAELPAERIRQIHLDITSSADWVAAIAITEREFGPLSVLVNNAGIYHTSPLVDTELTDWNRILETNLTGTFLGMKHAVPSLRRNGGGSIINLSSTAGMKGMLGLSAYGASKWGVRGLTKTAALEFARDGIRVNSVHPGIIRTAMAANVSDDRVAAVPIDRWGTVDDMASLVLYLASDESSFCTGSEFIIDGGSTTGFLPPRLG